MFNFLSQFQFTNVGSLKILFTLLYNDHDCNQRQKRENRTVSIFNEKTLVGEPRYVSSVFTLLSPHFMAG